VGVSVVGLDLSLTQTGVAVVEEGRVHWTGVVKSAGKRDDSLSDRGTRISLIVSGVRSLVDRTGAQLAVIEAPSFNSRFGSAHDRSGLWWRVVHMLDTRDIPVAQVTPMQRAKYGTGKGNADKKTVHAAVQKMYGRPDLPIKTNDEADAVLLAAMGARHLGKPCDVINDWQAEAMVKVVWP